MAPLPLPPTADIYARLYPLNSVCGDKGTVWIAMNKKSSSRLAIKVYELDKCKEELERIQEEITLVRKMDHKNVITYLNSLILDQQLWIIMPLFGFTSATRLIESEFTEGLSEYALALIVKDVLQGLQYIHARGIIHRAIRGSHILIQSDGRSVLTGFRNSINTIKDGKWEKTIHTYPAEAPSNLNWASPEMLKQDMEGYNEKTDIYSLGITMCELGNGKVPYCMQEPQLMLVEKFFGPEPFLLDANTCTRFMSENGKDSGVGGSYEDCLASLSKVPEKYFSTGTHDFVACCLMLDPNYRPSAERLSSFQFIKQMRKLELSLPEILHPIKPITADTVLKSPLNERTDTNSEDDDISWDLEEPSAVGT